MKKSYNQNQKVAQNKQSTPNDCIIGSSNSSSTCRVGHEKRFMSK